MLILTKNDIKLTNCFDSISKILNNKIEILKNYERMKQMLLLSELFFSLYFYLKQNLCEQYLDNNLYESV
jgi:hypothetical protein